MYSFVKYVNLIVKYVAKATIKNIQNNNVNIFTMIIVEEHHTYLLFPLYLSKNANHIQSEISC